MSPLGLGARPVHSEPTSLRSLSLSCSRLSRCSRSLLPAEPHYVLCRGSPPSRAGTGLTTETKTDAQGSVWPCGEESTVALHS